MDIATLQAEVNSLIQPMLDKGLVRPGAEFDIAANSRPCVVLRHEKPDGVYLGQSIHQFFRADTPQECFANARKWIGSLPTPEEHHRSTFLKLVGAAADYGNQHGIASDFVNPLTEAMHRLSENAIAAE